MSLLPLADRLDDLFSTLYRLRPIDASFIGQHEYDPNLSDFSADGIAVQLAELERLHLAFPLDETPHALPAELDRQVAAGYLASQLALWKSDHAPFRDPSVITGLAVLGIVGLLRRDFAPPAERLGSVMARIGGLPDLLAHAGTAAESAPAMWCQTALVQCRGGIELLSDGVPAFCREHDLAQPDTQALSAAISAFSALNEVLETASRTATRRPGCGRALLDLLLENTHHVSGGSDAVEALVLSELEAATEALEDAGRKLGGDWRSIVAQVQAERVPEAEVAIRHQEIFDNHRQLVIEKGLLTWPEYPLSFRSPPDWLKGAMSNAGVYPYHAAAPFDPKVPVDFIIPHSPGGTADITIMSNHVLHHAGVGHHVQNWFAYNRAETKFGRLSAVDSAGYIFIHSGLGMAEGWSSYVPGMIAEFGIADERQRLCMHFDRLRSATRGLVDVRLHAGTWNAGEAAAFLVAQTDASPEAAQAAVQRISHSPSSGSMYCVGPTLLRRLREAMVGQRPSPVELGQFHDAFLKFGSLPVPLIAETMMAAPTALST